jgi:hypothetical protein
VSEDRLCIVGDVHGYLSELARGLETAGLVDDQQHWVGGQATLAVLGDLMDRGPNGAGVVEFLMRLQREASQDGGKVITLLGNHEVLFIGARRFGSQPTESRGGSFLNDWERLGGQPSDMDGIDDERLAWLENLPAMALEQDHLLVHADSLLYADYGSSVDEVNRRIREVMQTDDRALLLNFLRTFSARFVFHGDEGPARADQFLERFGGSRIVHGHSPIARVAEQPPESVTGPLVYAEGRVINVDPGLYLGGPGFVYQATR